MVGETKSALPAWLRGVVIFITLGFYAVLDFIAQVFL